MRAAAGMGLQLLVKRRQMGWPQLGRRRAACGQSGSADRSLRLLPYDRQACDLAICVSVPMKWWGRSLPDWGLRRISSLVLEHR